MVAVNVEVLVPWRPDGDPNREAAWEWVQRRWQALYPHWPIVTGTCRGEWSTAAALNDAMAQSYADIVILVGADTVLNRVDVEQAVAAATLGRWVMVARELHRLSNSSTRHLLGKSPGVQAERLVAQRANTHLGWGPIVAPADLVRDVGWDDRFTGWGGEDDAFGLAMKALAGRPHRVPGGIARLLYHSRDRRKAHDSYPANLALLDRYRAADTPDAMRVLLAERRRCDFAQMGGHCRMLPHVHGPHRITVAA